MHSRLTLRSTLACLAAAAVFGGACRTVRAHPNVEENIQRPLRYTPDGTDFVISNGAEYFNRPLYGPNTAFRVDAGDRPQFSLFLPGRGGVVRLGVRTATGALWLDQARQITARYHPGSYIYDITDPQLGAATLRIVALPLYPREGLLLRLQWEGAGGDADLVWAFGGANGQRGGRDGDIGTERVPVSKFFALEPSFCRDNRFDVRAGAAVLHSKPGVVDVISSDASNPMLADANQWDDLGKLLASTGKDPALPVLLGHWHLSGMEPAFLALAHPPGRDDPSTELQTYRDVRRDPAAETRASAPSPTPSSGTDAPATWPAFSSEQLAALYDQAQAHRQDIAQKVMVDTPDPFINAAASALCVAGNAVWDERQGVFMHGAVAWRAKLLGWRGPYLGDDLGWFDREVRHLTYWSRRQNADPIPAQVPPPDEDSNLARDEPALHSNGDISTSHYDMNLVYIDELFRHLMWTGDLDMARKVWPLIQRHLAWEERLFRRPLGPDQMPLYEAYCCIWASDNLQYSGGGATHSSAYNYFHQMMAARLATLLGQDATPYLQEESQLQVAMNRALWIPSLGEYGEFKDLLGEQLVHAAPALWTFYHTVDSHVPDPMQAWQMSRYVDTQIPHLPLVGPQVPGGCFTLSTSNWLPYTWSTNNVVMAESAHTALAYWQSGRDDQAYALFKGCLLDSMYMGLCPGNVGMCTTFDMARGESQRDFADGVGATSRALVEGLFGIRPNLLNDEVVIRPGFPVSWNHARLQHPAITVAFTRQGDHDAYSIDSRFAKPARLRLQLAAPRSAVKQVMIDGQPGQWRMLDDCVGQPRIEIDADPAAHTDISVDWQGAPPSTITAPARVTQGSPIALHADPGADLLGVQDPQQALDHLQQDGATWHGVASGDLGDRTVFARLHQGSLVWWSPVMFEIRPADQIVSSLSQDPQHLRFTLTNNSDTPLNNDITFQVGSAHQIQHVTAAPWAQSSPVDLGGDASLVPGCNPVQATLPGGATVSGIVQNWSVSSSPGAKYDCISLENSFNADVKDIFRQRYLAPRSSFCSLSMPEQGIGGWCQVDAKFDVNDSGLRQAAAEHQNRLQLPDGVPLATPGSQGVKNIAFVSQWSNFPKQIVVPLSGNASHVYLLMAGSTNSMQSRIDNGEVLVSYNYGPPQRLALENPTTWWPIDQDYLIDDYAFARPEPLPIRVDLKSGQVRVLEMKSFKGTGGVVKGGAATVLDLPLDPTRPLHTLTVRAIANEVIIGLMSVTLAR